MTRYEPRSITVYFQKITQLKKQVYVIKKLKVPLKLLKRFSSKNFKALNFKLRIHLKMNAYFPKPYNSYTNTKF